MPILSMTAVMLGLKMAMAGYEALNEGRDELSPEQEAAVRAEGRGQKAEWKELLED